jgi:hypothetical protein
LAVDGEDEATRFEYYVDALIRDAERLEETDEPVAFTRSRVQVEPPGPPHVDGILERLLEMVTGAPAGVSSPFSDQIDAARWAMVDAGISAQSTPAQAIHELQMQRDTRFKFMTPCEDPRRSFRVGVGADGGLSELVVGGPRWVHLECIGDDIEDPPGDVTSWSARIGDACLTISVPREGDPRVDIERGYYSDVNGSTDVGNAHTLASAKVLMGEALARLEGLAAVTGRLSATFNVLAAEQEAVGVLRDSLRFAHDGAAITDEQYAAARMLLASLRGRTEETR